MLIGIILFYEVNDEVARWIAVVMHSFWLPQIVHSVYANAQRPLSRYEKRRASQAGALRGGADANPAASALGALGIVVQRVHHRHVAGASVHTAVYARAPLGAPGRVLGCSPHGVFARCVFPAVQILWAAPRTLRAWPRRPACPPASCSTSRHSAASSSRRTAGARASSCPPGYGQDTVVPGREDWAERTLGARMRGCGPQYQVPRYNYYVRLPERRRPTTASELEAGLQPDGGAAAEEVVCLICMSAIDQTATHMVTPCRHSFHSACLERVRPRRAP